MANPAGLIERERRALEQRLAEAEAELRVATARAKEARGTIEAIQDALALLAPPAPEREALGPGDVPNLRLMKSRKAAVLEVLRSTQRPMGIEEVLHGLRVGGRPEAQDWYGVVATTLHNLRQQGDIRKVGRGVYQAAS